ncbi:MAG: HEPN domain-containing protein [Candidatus Aenigmatarchaeota archaeon]
MKKDTEEIIKLAEDNLVSAKKVLEIGVNRISCFLAQQAIELFLKAFLTEKNVFNPKKHKTHNLRFLIKECKKLDKDFESLEGLKEIDKISSYAVLARYDAKFSEVISEQEAKEAIEIAEKVKEFVLKKLKL